MFTNWGEEVINAGYKISLQMKYYDVFLLYIGEVTGA